MNIKKLRVVIYPHPALKQKATKIDEITDEIRAIGTRMIEVCKGFNNGIGLAANQVGLPINMFVTVLNGREEVYINPELELSGLTEYFEEGCLSMPGKKVMVGRPKTAKITYQALDGTTRTEENSELLGRCWQHEFDHLQGIMITERGRNLLKASSK